MKKYFILVALAATALLPSSTLGQDLDNLFGSLDETQVSPASPTGSDSEPWATRAQIEAHVLADLYNHRGDYRNSSPRRSTTGSSRRVAVPSGHRKVYQEVASWNPASKGWVDGRVAKAKTEAIQAAEGKRLAAEKVSAQIPATAGVKPGVPADTAKAEEKSKMWDPYTTLIWVIVLLLVFSIGHWMWGNLVRRNGLLDVNHVETGSFTPDNDKWGEFRDETTKVSHNRHGVSEAVAIAREQSRQADARAREAAADARIAEAASRAANRQAMIAGIAAAPAPVYLVGTVPAGAPAQQPAPNAPAPITVNVNNTFPAPAPQGGGQGGGRQAQRGGGGGQANQPPAQQGGQAAPNP